MTLAIHLWLLHSLGDVIYGRVMVDPVQNLGDSFICNIEKVFLCTGADGYIPKFNPDNFEYGCLADSPSLLYRFKIIVSMNTNKGQTLHKKFLKDLKLQCVSFASLLPSLFENL